MSLTVDRPPGRQSPLWAIPWWLHYTVYEVLPSFGMLFFHREGLASEISADVSHHGVVSLDINALRAMTDLENVVVSLGHPARQLLATCFPLMVLAFV